MASAAVISPPPTFLTVPASIILPKKTPNCALVCGPPCWGSNMADRKYAAEFIPPMDGGKPAANNAACEEPWRSEEHTSELQSRGHLVCRLLLEKKKQEQKTA